MIEYEDRLVVVDAYIRNAHDFAAVASQTDSGNVGFFFSLSQIY